MKYLLVVFENLGKKTKLVKTIAESISIIADKESVKYSYEGDIRQFRGSIYIDGVVPETEDKEFDRKAALKVMEFFANKTNANQYVGGVGFKRRDITNPFDKDF